MKITIKAFKLFRIKKAIQLYFDRITVFCKQFFYYTQYENRAAKKSLT